ncbi:conserved hypothetical protein [Beutenbergia cavernae DSM 12333]|uniref:Transcriptional regulator protein-like protein n=1 Tax=Beutenbergia cavernae (strain ATCC BAA-8 / DSM 12333 / CCUG 43141 / JCM 11478 / NBRC 16432 / NCIMB 13614 / HKI 0122) TaxID=471853 RepID=C5C6A7_BEUC1|nr:WYL domain-containing protein [Beutenbergia cavernae]ACQ80313.1 conserved hypothetical protein [Beutenbergia cavernae DSM 12333]
MAETATDRLTRLLALITYVEDNPGVPVAQVADHFGVSEAQVLSDVDTLWVSGTPGYLPDDLIDFAVDSYEQNLLTLTESRGMDRPLRLGPTEAVALLVALRALARVPGFAGDDVVASALEKLTSAAGEAASAADAIDVRLGTPNGYAGVQDTLRVLRGALVDGRRVHLRYVSASDAVSERDVDPLQIVSDGDRWFLRAWCHRAGDVRHFRLDRVLAADVLDEPVAAHPEVGEEHGVEPSPSPTDTTVVLELTARSRWVGERFGGDVTDLGDGWIRVSLRVADPAWLAGLVLGLGEDVRRVSPPDVARSIAGRARAALEAYESHGAAVPSGSPDPAE